MNEIKTIYSIGHSTLSIEEFLKRLGAYKIKQIADVRRFPGSAKYPWFNKENFELLLAEHDINYSHIELLGGRRKADKDSSNTVWKNKSFQGYADYMENPEFLKGINILLKFSAGKPTAMMCSEAVWWRCHRSMISDYLKSIGIKVIHIMAENNSKEHTYTRPAKIIEGKLFYGREED